jgi:hypothetical protein
MVPLNPGDVGEVSKAGVALLDKVSDALGWILKPVQIKRVAEAEVDALVIRTKGEIAVTELQRRAFTRLLAEETRAQTNMEDIAFQAMPALEDTAQFEHMDDDWITNFFDKCRMISDEQMQQVWSKVLAGEANHPGSFSKRTVTLLGAMDKKDASLFTALCSFNWTLQGELTPFIYDPQHSIYKTHDISADTLWHLSHIGVIVYSGSVLIQRTNCPRLMEMNYHGARFRLELPNDGAALPIGRVALTQAGRELAQLCNVTEVPGYADFIVEKFTKLNAPITLLNGGSALSVCRLS